MATLRYQGFISQLCPKCGKKMYEVKETQRLSKHRPEQLLFRVDFCVHCAVRDMLKEWGL